MCFGYKPFLAQAHSHAQSPALCKKVRVCDCMHVSLKHCFNACKKGLWEYPSFIAEMIENLEWKEDLRV